MPLPTPNEILAEVVVMLLAARFTGGRQAVVVNVVVAGAEVSPGAQLLTTLTVYVVPGVRPDKVTGEAVGAGVTVVAVPPCGVYVTV